MQSKKGQGISLNVIIIAVIALLVLAIVSFLLFKYTGNTSDSLDSCVDMGGNADEDGCVEQCSGINLGSQYCETDGEVCCKELG